MDSMFPINDGKTTISASEAAIITKDCGTDLEFLMPRFDGEDEVPELMIVLMACFIRLTKEPAFFEEQMEWARGGLVEVSGGMQ